MNPYLGLSDEKLMEEYIKDNMMAFEVLYNRHNARVYSYISKRVFDLSNAQEIFQNIFLKVHKLRFNYDQKHIFLKWLYTICRSELIDYFKYKKGIFEEFNEAKVIKDIPDITEPEINLEDYKNLTSNEKKALELRYYSEKDFDEISSILNTTPTNSRKIISRGIGKLRKKLKGGKIDRSKY